jgi:hypothetical protein
MRALFFAACTFHHLSDSGSGDQTIIDKEYGCMRALAAAITGRAFYAKLGQLL